MTEKVQVEAIDGGPIGLARKLANVLGAIDRIPKRGENTSVGGGYKYVMDADVLDTARTALAEQDVAVLSGVTAAEHLPYTTSGGKPQFLTTIHGFLSFIDGVSGERFDVPFVSTGADNGDKGLYKAWTSGVKYLLLKSFLVPTGDDVENEGPGPAQPVRPAAGADRGQATGGTRAPDVSAPRQPRAASQPAAQEQPRIVGQGPGLTDPQRRKLMAMYREAGIEGDQRHAFQFLVTGKNSTKEMTHPDFEKLVDVLENPTEPNNAEFIENAKFVKAKKDE